MTPNQNNNVAKDLPTAQNKDWDVCKFLIFALRHKPEIAKLKLDEHGFTHMDRIVSYLVKIRKIDTSKEKLISLIDSQMKKTLEIKGEMVRAISGHSVILSMKIPQDFDLCQNVPKKLYGSVDTNSIFMAMKNGLTSNLLRSELVSDQSTLEKKPQTSIVIIDSDKAMKENVQFHVNKNGHYFSIFVPQKFIHFKIK
jgi:RNA:NAD 2'-phosphotransferase (TPT1/KptA family)